MSRSRTRRAAAVLACATALCLAAPSSDRAVRTGADDGAHVATTPPRGSGETSLTGASDVHATITDLDFPDLGATDESIVVTATVTAAAGYRLRLERGSHDAWATVAEVVLADTDDAATSVPLPVPSHAGDATYRVVLTPDGPGTVRTSPELSIFQSDAEAHAAYVARARHAVHAYCPLTPVYVDSPDVRSGTTVGKARSSWSWADGSARWEQSIQLRSGLTDQVLEHTALHECAHIVQVRPLLDGMDAYEASTARAARLYAGRLDPGEHQADCMASVMTGRTSDMFYARECSSRQRADARRMWREHGDVGQLPSLTWAWTG